MKNKNKIIYYDDKYFKPVTGIFYDVFIKDKKLSLQIEFTNEPVYEEEEIIEFNSFECWEYFIK
jgi:hypothetical protein